MSYDIKKWMTIAENLSESLTVKPTPKNREKLRIEGFTEFSFPIVQKVFVQDENGRLVIHGELLGEFIYDTRDGQSGETYVDFRYYPHDNVLEFFGYDEQMYHMARDIAEIEYEDDDFNDEDVILSIKEMIELDSGYATRVVHSIANEIHNQLGRTFSEIDAHRTGSSDSLLDLSESSDINIYSMKNGKIDFSVNGKHYSIHQQQNIVTETEISGSVEFDVIIENKFASVVISDFKAEYSAILETGEIDEQAIDDAIHSEFENDDDHLRHLASKMDDEDLKRLGVDVNDMGEVLDLLYEITNIVYIENALEAIRKDISSIRDRFGSTFDEVAHNLEAYRSSPSDSLLFISESEVTVLPSKNKNSFFIKSPYGDFEITKGQYDGLHVKGTMVGDFLENLLESEEYEIRIDVSFFIDSDGSLSVEYVEPDEQDMIQTIGELADESFFNDNPNVEGDSDEYYDGIRSYEDYYFDNTIIDKEKIEDEVIEPLAELIVKELGTSFDEIEAHRKHPSDSLLNLSESQLTVLGSPRSNRLDVKTPYGEFTLAKSGDHEDKPHLEMLIDGVVHGGFLWNSLDLTYEDIDVHVYVVIDPEGTITHSDITLRDRSDVTKIVSRLAHEALMDDNPNVEVDSDEYRENIQDYKDDYFDSIGFAKNKLIREVVEPLAKLVASEFDTLLDDMESRRKHPSDSLLNLSESQLTVLPGGNVYRAAFEIRTPYGNFEISSPVGVNGLYVEAEIHGDYFKNDVSGTYHDVDIDISFTIDSDGNVSDVEIVPDEDDQREVVYDLAQEMFMDEYPDVDPDGDEYWDHIHEYEEYYYDRTGLDEDKVMYDIIEPLAELIIAELGTSFDEIEAKRSGTSDSLLSLSESNVTILPSNFENEVIIKTPHGHFTARNGGRDKLIIDGQVHDDFLEDKFTGTSHPTDVYIHFVVDSNGNIIDKSIEEDDAHLDEFLDDVAHDPFQQKYPNLDKDNYDYHTLFDEFKYDYSRKYVSFDEDRVIKEIVNPLAKLIMKELGTLFDELEAKRSDTRDSLLDISESKVTLFKRQFGGFSIDTPYGYFEIDSDDHGGIQVSGDVYHDFIVDRIANTTYEAEATITFIIDRDGELNHSNIDIDVDYESEQEVIGDAIRREFDNEYPGLDPDSTEYEDLLYDFADGYYNYVDIDTSAIIDELIEPLANLIVREIGSVFDDMEAHRKHSSDSLLNISESAEPDIREMDSNIFQILAPGMGRYVIDNNSLEGTTISGDITVDVTVSNIHVYNDIKAEDEISYRANLDTEEVYITETYTSTLEIFQDTFDFSDEFLEEQGIDPEDWDAVSDFLYDTSTIEYPTESEVENLVKQDIREFKQRFGHSFDEIESKRTQPKDSILNIEESSNPMRKLINIIERASK